MDKNERHNQAMVKQKKIVDEKIEKANIDRGVAVLLIGDRKEKTSSTFGVAIRALEYEQRLG